MRHHGKGELIGQANIGTTQRSELAHHARHYLQVGGFPEMQDETPAVRRDILRNYVDTVLLRDVIERHGASNTVALRALARKPPTSSLPAIV